MYNTDTVFSQIMEYVPWRRLQTIVDKYGGDLKSSKLKTNAYFRVMAFAQLTERRSLRDIVSCLNAMKPKLYHMGIRSVSRNNLSNASQKRDWKIFAELGNILIAEAKVLYGQAVWNKTKSNPVFALDSTTIDLCLSLFDWADFRSTKAAIKVHTLLDVHTGIPHFIRISKGKMHDVNILDELPITAGAYYVMDRGYNDFKRLYRIDREKASFVVRAKKNTKVKRIYSRTVDKSTGLRCDQTVAFIGFYSRKSYPQNIRRIKYYDEEHKRRLVFLTNDFDLSALAVADLYKKRWQVELFFKWIKQNLRVKRFFGQSENAVRSQIWISICTYLLVAILRKRLKIDRPMAEILHIFNLVQFENTPIITLFGDDSNTSAPSDPIKTPFLPGFLMGQ